MGCDSVRARHISDQGDRLRNAFRSGERRVCRLRRILHRHSVAARRIVPTIATLTTVAALCKRRGPKCDGHRPPLQQAKRMGDRAVYCARLESVCAERHPGFESPPIRQVAKLTIHAAFTLALINVILLFSDLCLSSVQSVRLTWPGLRSPKSGPSPSW